MEREEANPWRGGQTSNPNPPPPLWDINWKVKREFWSFNPPLRSALIAQLPYPPLFSMFFQSFNGCSNTPSLLLFLFFFFFHPFSIHPRLRNTWKISLILARPLACLPGEITHLQTSLFWEWKFVSTVTTCYYDFAPRTGDTGNRVFEMAFREETFPPSLHRWRMFLEF